MNFVFALAARELRASVQKLAVFFLCIAIGVSAIVALRSVIERVAQVFTGEARELIAADLVLSSDHPIGAELAGRIERRLRDVRAIVTQGIDVATMVRRADRPAASARMVEVRAIEAGYPHYGRIELEGGVLFDHDRLRDFGALVAPELASEFGLRTGDRLLIGEREFSVRGVIVREPGRRMGVFSVGPRVLLARADLEATGLLAYGSRAGYRRFVKLPEGQLKRVEDGLRSELSDSSVRMRSATGTEDELGENFKRAENYLSLVGLVILILGGIGVSSVIGVFVQQKIYGIAVLKCVGARSSQLLAAYLLQVAALGLLGGLCGVALAAAGLQAIPDHLLASLTSGPVRFGVTLSAALQGLSIGLLVALVFALVPLLEVRDVKPSLLLREASAVRRPLLPRLLAGLLLASVVLGLAVWQAGSWRIGLMVVAGLCAMAGVLHGTALVLTRALAPLASVGWFPLRHAALKLIRPQSPARVVLLTVGLGSCFTLGVRSLQEMLTRELSFDFGSDAADTFLLDVQSDQVDPLRALLQAEGHDSGLRLLPMLRARVTGVKGRTLELKDHQDVRGRGSLGREYMVTYRAGLERNETLVEGRVFGAGPSTTPEVSIETSLRDRYGLAIGDLIRFDVLGRTIEARVSSVRRVNWTDTRAGGFMFVFRPGVFERAPHGYIGFLRGPAGQTERAQLRAALVSRFPNLSVIDGREMLGTMQRVLEGVTTAVSAVGSLVVLSGLLILLGAIAMTKYRRVYEIAIFETLGATRGTLLTTLLLEYAVLGALAGALGALGSMALGYLISRFALDLRWHALPALSLTAILLCTALVAAIGVLASASVLRQKPLATLRAK